MIITIIISVSTILISFALVLLLGRYIQNKYHLLISNTYISYAIGFSVYIAIVTIIFMPVVFFAWPTFMLLSVWWIFNILLVIFLFLNWKVIDIRNISIKQLLIFIVLAMILLVTTRFLSTSPNSGNNYFFVKWVKNNVDIPHLNDGVNIDKYHFGAGWYYFQTALLRTLNIDQLFMNFWVLGAIVNMFIASSMLGFVYSIIKKNNIFILSASIGVAIFVAATIYNGEIENIGDISLLWNFVLLLTLLINFISQPKIHYMYLMAIISYAGWGFSSKELILSVVFIVSGAFVLLFKKSHLLVEFVLIFSYSIITMIIILIFNISYVAFSISFIAAIAWLLLALFTVNKNMKECHEYSLMFYKSRWVIFYGSLMAIVGVSLILWFFEGRDHWLYFKYDRDLISNFNNYKFAQGIGMYVIYGISAIISIWLIEREIRNGISDDKVKLLLLISGFGIIFFFNPIVAPLWNHNILPDNVYYNISIETLLPFIIIIPILLNKIKWNQIMQSTIFVASIISVVTLFNINTFRRSHVSMYNGADSTIKELADYINGKQKYRRMAGDIDGLLAYVPNSLSFNVDSKSFNLLRDNKLTSERYSKVDNKVVDILIKFSDNIATNFDFNAFKSQYNFNNYIIVGHYYIFYK